MHWLKKIFGGSVSSLLTKWIPNPIAAAAVETGLSYVIARALPLVITAGDWIVNKTVWTQTDNTEWRAVKAMYPSLFAGGSKTEAETKLVASLIVRAQLMALAKDLTSAQAAIAVEVAVTQAAADGAITTATVPKEA